MTEPDTAEVWVVVTTHEDDRGDTIEDNPRRCFATRELAEQVAAIDGGTVTSWPVRTTLPRPRNWIHRSLKFYASGEAYQADTINRERMFSHPKGTWRGVYVGGWHPSPEFVDLVTIEMSCEDTAANAAWFESQVAKVRYDIAAVIAAGTHYDHFTPTPTEDTDR